MTSNLFDLSAKKLSSQKKKKKKKLTLIFLQRYSQKELNTIDIIGSKLSLRAIVIGIGICNQSSNLG